MRRGFESDNATLEIVPVPCHEDDMDAKKENSLAHRLLRTRTLLLNGPVGEDMAQEVVTQALILDADSHDPIRVIVTTPGGSVDFGFAIYDILRYVESEVICIGAGFVASMGVPIMLAAKPENRYALPNTRFMMHQPSMSGVAGQAKDIRITAQEIIKTRERINQLIADETGKSIDKIQADSDRDYWMSAEEAVEYGLISKIIRTASDLR